MDFELNRPGCTTKGGICGSGIQCCGQLNCQYDDRNQGANGTCVDPGYLLMYKSVNEASSILFSVCGSIGTPCGGRHQVQCCQGLNCLKSKKNAKKHYNHHNDHNDQGGPINKICKKRNPLEEKPWNWLG